MHKVLGKKELAKDVTQLVIEAPVIAVKAQAGQFVVIILDEQGERIPLTLADWHKEKGSITLIRGNLSVLSYYTGPETGYYIILILSEEDDPDIYEGAMSNVAQLILKNLEDDVYIEMIPSIFQRLSVYPSLSYEQNLIYYYPSIVG